MVGELAILLLSATVGLSVDVIGDAPGGLRADLLREFTSRVETLEGSTVVLDEAASECMAGSQCVADLRSRTSSLDVVTLRIIGGPIRVRVLAERTTATDRTLSAELELRRDALDARTIAQNLARTLGFEPIAVGPTQSADAASDPPNWVALSMTGLGVLALGTGVVFGLSSHAASADVSTAGLPNAEIMRLDDRADRDAVVANVLFGVATTAVIGGLLSWAFD